MFQLGDFAHFLFTSATYLATDLEKTGFWSNFATLVRVGSRTRVEWMSGWLGDATIRNDDGVITFGPDDYIADLDAANIAHIMRTQNQSFQAATNLYFAEVGVGRTRAEMFLEHTPFETVVWEIFRELDMHDIGVIGNPMNLHNMDLESVFDFNMEIIAQIEPNDTYRFIRSLQNPADHHEMMSQEDLEKLMGANDGG